jgi:thiamine-phosphate diphosphorylase
VHPVVCMITDRRRFGQHPEATVIRRVALAARAGIHLIQIRERDMSDDALLTLVAQAVEAVRGTRARVLVNDRVDVAIAAGAHGVHLRGDSAPAIRVRSAAPPAFLIGRSVHSCDEVSQLRDEGGLDYLLFGTVFETASKPDQEAAGVDRLAAAVIAAKRLPVLAVGGVTRGTVSRLAPSGCSGFAAIGQFADGPEDDLAATVTAALAAWENPS